MHRELYEEQCDGIVGHGAIVVNGVRLHVTRTGGNKPPVVLAHGFSGSGLCWTPMAQALEAEYDIVMVDARGHGFSDAPEMGYTLTQLASDLQGVIASLGLVRPAILGHSMGGGTTLALAGLFPDVPGAIILEDAGALEAADFPLRQEGQENPFLARLARLQTKTHDELIAEQRASLGWSDAELEPMGGCETALQPACRTVPPHPCHQLDRAHATYPTKFG